jgi:Chromo (CHRromatin Organisation MOdifier) domain
VFHIDHLSPWEGNEVHGYNPPPLDPIEVDKALEYEVKQILDSHKYRNQLQYLVKWQGYDQGHNSWEPATNLTHCSELIKDFHAKHPAIPHRIAASIFH